MSSRQSITEKWQALITSACDVHGQAGLADMLGVSRTTISHWKNHGVLPDIISLSGYCRALGVELIDIVDETINVNTPRVLGRDDLLGHFSLLPANEKKKVIVEMVKRL